MDIWTISGVEGTQVEVKQVISSNPLEEVDTKQFHGLKNDNLLMNLKVGCYTTDQSYNVISTYQ